MSYVGAISWTHFLQERMAVRPESYRSDLPVTGLVELYRDNSAESVGGGGKPIRSSSSSRDAQFNSNLFGPFLISFTDMPLRKRSS